VIALGEWMELLACPACGGALQAVEEGLGCAPCGRRYPLSDGLVACLPPAELRRFDELAQGYREARLRDGWQPMTAEEAWALPEGRPAGYPALYWEVRRQSCRALWRALAQRAALVGACVADLGAGTGWLSHRLAQLGGRVVAVESSRDQDFGLGAAARHYLPRAAFLPVLGDLERPPLAEGRFDLIVYNASLHYAGDLEATLRRGAAALKAGGWLVVMDTPIAREPLPGTGRGDRHLGRRELAAALAGAGLRESWLRVMRGPRWWLRQAKVLIKGSEPFSFPLVVAERDGSR